MQTYIIESIPRDSEEAELVQAGDDYPSLLQKLSLLLLLGERVLTVHRSGQPVETREFLDMMLHAVQMLAINRLSVSLAISMEDAEDLFGAFLGIGPSDAE